MASLSPSGELATDLSFRSLVCKSMVENNQAGVGHAAAICFLGRSSLPFMGFLFWYVPFRFLAWFPSGLVMLDGNLSERTG